MNLRIKLHTGYVVPLHPEGPAEKEKGPGKAPSPGIFLCPIQTSR